MKKKNFDARKSFFLLVLAFFLAFFAFSIYTILSGIISFAELEGWDGKKVAEQFSKGNGTEENPYVIHNAEEYMYFKSLIEGDTYTAYQDKYYILDANIDFNGHEITPIGVLHDPKVEVISGSSEEVPVAEEKIEEAVKEENTAEEATEETTEVEVKTEEVVTEEIQGSTLEERFFKGHFDGQGYSLSNFKMKEGSVIEGTSYFALFNVVDEGTIKQLNVDNYKIEVPEGNNVVVSGLIGIVKKGTLENVSLRDFNISVKKNESVTFGIIAANSDDDTEFNNIYVNGEIDDVNKGLVRYFEKGKSKVIISDIKYDDTILSNNIEELYLVKDDVITLNGEEVSSEDLLTVLNDGLESDYYWKYDNGMFYFLTHQLDVVEIPDENKGFNFSIQGAGNITLHNTGKDGTSVYFNELTNDLNYYLGKNYTEITNTTGTIPDGTNRGLYSNSNLATVYIRYSGADLNDSSITGKLSVSENYTDFYYYRRYPVVNGYVEFDLIDSPWGNRPTNRAFNGWVTDDPNAVISLDMDTYVRSVKIPISDVSTPYSITFYSSWTLATTVAATGDLGDLKAVGMTALTPGVAETLTDYYCAGHVTRYNNYPNSNYLYSRTGTRINSGAYCNTNGGCDYIDRCDSNTYDPSTTYYSITPIENSDNVTVSVFTPTISRPIGYYNSGYAAGYFKRVTSGSTNIYSATGVKQTSCSGTCYQLMQYSDGALDPGTTYYYLTTRDTNIFAPSTTNTITTSTISTTRPMTVTGINNGTDNSNNRTIQLNNSWTMNSDVRVEYIRFYTNETDTDISNFDSDGYKIIGNFKNLKLGRGLRRNGTYLTATSFVGGSNSSTSGVENYTLIVESGYYQNGSGVGFLGTGWNASTGTHRVNALVTLGNDFDKITTANNGNLDVAYCYAGSWASNLYNVSTSTNTYDTPAVKTIVKSGIYGSNEDDYAAGVYAGGRGNGTHYALREVLVEGGDIYNLIGGPMSSDGRAGKNDIVISVTGGTIDFIFGGAGASNTIGNRIISVTGGTVNYSILGGSNAYTTGSSNPYGKIDGDTLVYVGGNVTVGGGTGSLYNITAGNVFGAGNGRNGELDVGSVNNANVIIGPSANIKGSVYGGGNFGAVGGNLTGTSTYTPGQSSEEEEELIYKDGTADDNIRYYGDNPHNYIQINGVYYRIIGLFNNVDTPDGTKDLVRIVKETSYNNNVAWANAYITVGTGRDYSNYYVRTNNDIAAIYNTLNTTYYNSLNATTRGYIQEATWPLGAVDNPNHTASAFYTGERSTTAGSSYSTTSASFRIGMFYPSDYGFASGESCLGTNLSNFGGDCTNWLGSAVTSSAWTMTPSTYYENIYNSNRRDYNSFYVFYLNANKTLNYNGVAYRNGNNYSYRSYAVFPSFYLRDDLKISGGTGTRNDPYVIGNNGDLLTEKLIDLATPKIPDDDPYEAVEDDGNYQEGTDYQARTHIHIVGGTIEGSVYGAGNNNGSGNKSGNRVANSKVTIDIDSGTINESVYGGSNERGTVYGDVLINVNNGSILGSVYGGGKGGGANGTYVSRNVDVNIGSASTAALTISENVYGGSAFGTVNGIAAGEGPNESHVRVTVNKGTITGSVFGGGQGDSSYSPNEYGNIFVHINGGNMTNVFGGNDSKGSPSANDVVYLNGGTIGNAYGGGNNTGQTYSDIRLQGSTITGNLYGGSNASGDVLYTHVTVSDGSVTEIYGGNNLGGTAGSTYTNITGGTISTAVYGGGKQAETLNSTTTNITGCTVPEIYGGGKNAGVGSTAKVTLNNVTSTKVFGGSNASGDVGTSNVTVTGSQITSVYGGNNSGGSTETTHVTVGTSTITNVFGGGDNASSTTSNINVQSGTITNVYGGGNEAGVETTNVTIAGGSVTNAFGGSNTTGDIDTANVTVTGGTIGTLFGGNNLGGDTGESHITATGGSATTVYGGGNKASIGETDLDLTDFSAGTIFGGGNEAPVNGDVSLKTENVTATGSVYGGGNAAGVTGNVLLDINNSSVTGNVFGGGNEGTVNHNTEVFITSSSIGTNVYAGGNGATAIVKGNSSVTIDGTTTVGSSTTTAPGAGCVFGSGNAAATGSTNTSSVTTVNIAGGEIFGNVYGGAKMSVVYGATDTNIGMAAIPNSTGLTEGKIHIHGTVFGGGESNESGSDVYDYTFISVTEGINIDIDGTDYDTHNHDFIINGSIFGSGNASSSQGNAYLKIKNLGSMSKPNRAISIQRFYDAVIESSAIELMGAKDRTNDLVDFEYSFNQIDKLTIKNNTTLFLQHNANLLKEFYSGVDVGGNLVKAAVTIDDDTKTVTKNVDNRIYMVPGENLHIAVNQSATAYGKVSGMTFYGMYTSGDSNNYRLGLYDPQYDYGDAGNASLEIVGGSYVVGLRNENHDITVDGFYSNSLDEANYTEIITKYINPSPIGQTGYRWIIGFEAINYTVPLTISKYSTLGTYELSMIDFAQGNSTFTILGFDSNGLEDVELIDSNLVPRIAPTEEEANGVLGLAMKVETQEWTGSGTTKFFSRNGGEFTGGQEYVTDSRQVAPSVMFYAYHAKNFTRTGSMGECVVTLQVATPKNEIEFDIKFVTITVEITGRAHDEGVFYDASITYDKKYEMPAATDVFITNQSQFTTYFSLTEYFQNFAAAYGRNNEYYRVITFTRPLPEGTIITMMDMSANSSRPEYYYYRITNSVYTASVEEWEDLGEVAYRLSNFIKMDSTSTTNTYDDQAANLLYYDTNTNMADEEFLFIIDMKESSESGEHLNNKASFELRNSDNFGVINVVSGRDALMVYNTFESSNVVLSQNFTDVDSYLYYNVADSFNYSTSILYNQTENRQSIIDTNYEYSNMGLNIVFYDRTGDPVSSSLLLGTSVSIGNKEYFADGEGVIRIKLANKVSNIEKVVKLVPGRNLPPGTYTVRYTLFASEDGLHNSDFRNSVYSEFNVTVVSSSSYIAVDCEDTTKLVYGETGKNHANSKINTYTVEYISELNNPNFRVEVYKRRTNDVNAVTYDSVPFSTLFKNNYTVYAGNEVTLPVTEPDEETFDFELADTLTSGTYRVVFKLYDNNQLIDSDTKNVIVQKKLP